MAIYLLHFSRPYRHARHYLGFADDVQTRIKAHKNGTGARLTQVVTDAGIELILVRVWPNGDRQTERKLKDHKHAPRLCPVCTPGTKRGESVMLQSPKCENCGRVYSTQAVRCPHCGHDPHPSNKE